MTPLSKCVSLETAKRLKAAGFPQDTERMYLMTPCGYHGHENWELFDSVTTALRRYDMRVKSEHKIAAPDATEIGELLPYKLREEDESSHYFFNQMHNQNGWYVEYLSYGIPFRGWSFHGQNEAEARAACWLYLKEKNLI